jgi:hypothetical protein
VLRSRQLDGIGAASEVHDRAGALIDVLKGAVALSQDAGSLKYVGVAELSSDGELHKYAFFRGMPTWVASERTLLWSRWGRTGSRYRRHLLSRVKSRIGLLLLSVEEVTLLHVLRRLSVAGARSLPS